MNIPVVHLGKAKKITVNIIKGQAYRYIEQ